jgi:hypothetical protein
MPTLTELEERKARYLASEAEILKSQDYTVGDGVVSRRNRRADLAEVRRQIAELDSQIASLTPSAGRRVYYGTPRR